MVRILAQPVGRSGADESLGATKETVSGLESAAQNRGKQMNYDDWKTESPEDEHCRLYHRGRSTERCKHGNPIGNDCCIEECEECAEELRLEQEADEAENREEYQEIPGSRDRDEWRHEAAEAQRLK